MWYKESISSEYTFQELDDMLVVYDSARNNIREAANQDLFHGLAPRIMKKGLQIGMGLLKNKVPQYNLPIEAMERYLSGKGKDYQLSSDMFSDEMKRDLFIKALRAYGETHNREPLPPDTVQEVLWDYGDYTLSEINKRGEDNSPEYGDINDDFSGNPRRSFMPLRYVVGGFTAYLWYTVNGEANQFDIHMKMEDTYDWHGEAYTEYNLPSLGIAQHPKLMQLIDRIDHPGISKSNDRIKITDKFWDSLAQQGLAKPYKHTFEGKLTSQPIPPNKQPLFFWDKVDNPLYIVGNAQRIEGDASNIKGNVNYIAGDVSRLSGDVSYITGNVSNISGDVSQLSGHVGNLIGDVTGLAGRIQGDLCGDVSNIYGIISGIMGPCTSSLSGDVSRVGGDIGGVRGAISPNLIGDISKLRGDISDIFGDVNKMRLPFPTHVSGFSGDIQYLHQYLANTHAIAGFDQYDQTVVPQENDNVTKTADELMIV